MHTYCFSCRLRVSLIDGSTVLRGSDIPVRAPDFASAREALEDVALELCDDKGSDWFDAPVESVKIISADRVR